MANQTILGMNIILVMTHFNEQGLAFSSKCVTRVSPIYLRNFKVTVIYPLPLIAVGEHSVLYSRPKIGLSKYYTLGCISISTNFSKTNPRRSIITPILWGKKKKPNM